MIDILENKLRNIIKQEVRNILNEDNSSVIYKIEGKLITDTSKNNQKDILSDIRSIAGITIVGTKETGNERTIVKNSNYTTILTIKIDPQPFISKSGFGRKEIIQTIKEKKRIKGVRNFTLTKSPIKTTN